jgi:hypothetical protein
VPALEPYPVETAPLPFASLGLDSRLLEGVRDLGFSETRPIQTAVITLSLAGSDLIACAETGSGKTCAFVVPMLQRLRASSVCIDRKLISGVPQDTERAGLARALIALARGMNFEVVAKGVESPAQREFLSESGCRIWQGSLFAVADSADAVAPMQFYGRWDFAGGKATTVNSGSHVTARFQGTGKKKILLIAHMDTVYVKGTLAKAPFNNGGAFAYASPWYFG